MTINWISIQKYKPTSYTLNQIHNKYLLHKKYEKDWHILLQQTDRTFTVGGVDEAGRGSIIGPLVVAGISFKKASIYELRKIGVKDSKALTPKSRASLFAQLKEMASSISIY